MLHLVCHTCVGDGNFSFSLSKAQQLSDPRLLIATSYDSREELAGKYPNTNVLENLQMLSNLGRV